MTEQSETIFNPKINETLIHYLHLLLDANAKTNLTAIREFDDAYVKHLQDSLSISLWSEWKQLKRGIDLGTGGGLPGIPLAICYQDKQFYLMESNNKKVNFLRDVVQELKLENVEVIHGRAEEYGQNTQWRESMDFVISRAVSSINVLIELSMPFLKLNGSLIAYKGPSIEEELSNSTNAMKLLGATDYTVISYQLPLQMGNRNIIMFKKHEPTSKIYPRRPGIPEKRPL